MAEQQNQKAVSELEKIHLEPNEIMRISVFETEDGEYQGVINCNGPSEPIKETITEAAKLYDMVCVPKEVFEILGIMRFLPSVISSIIPSEDETEQSPKGESEEKTQEE